MYTTSKGTFCLLIIYSTDALHEFENCWSMHVLMSAFKEKPYHTSLSTQCVVLCRLNRYFDLKQMCSLALTGLCLASSLRTSGAIHPSVPGTPDLLLKLCLPAASFLHRPKSEIMARTRPWAFGMDTRMLCGFRSLWTTETQRCVLRKWNFYFVVTRPCITWTYTVTLNALRTS